jgi:hypothetical protein
MFRALRASSIKILGLFLSLSILTSSTVSRAQTIMSRGELCASAYLSKSKDAGLLGGFGTAFLIMLKGAGATIEEQAEFVKDIGAVEPKHLSDEGKAYRIQLEAAVGQGNLLDEFIKSVQKENSSATRDRVISTLNEGLRSGAFCDYYNGSMWPHDRKKMKKDVLALNRNDAAPAVVSFSGNMSKVNRSPADLFYVPAMEVTEGLTSLPGTPVKIAQ